MGDRFDGVVVGVDGFCEELFAVTGGADAQDVELDAVFFVAVRQIDHGALEDGERFAVVAGVETIDDLFVFIDEHELRGRRTGIDAQVGVDGRAGGRLRIMVVRHLVFFEEQLVFGFVLEEQVGGCLGLVFCLANFVKMNECVERAFFTVHAFLVCEHGTVSECGTHGHEHFGVFRDNRLFVRNAQTFLERLHESRVERERATFKNDRWLDFHTLGQATDGLFCNGVEARKGDIFLGDTVVEHRLDVRLGEHTATARDFIDLLATLGIAFEYFGLDTEEFCDLVDKCTCTAGADPVHAHVGGYELARCFVLFEENNLGVLTTEFDSDSRFGVGGTHGECVGDDFLYKKGMSGFGERLTAATAEGDPKVLARKKCMCFAQHFMDFLRLHGVVALISIMQKLRCLGIDYGNFHSGGANIDPNP